MAALYDPPSKNWPPQNLAEVLSVDCFKRMLVDVPHKCYNLLVAQDSFDQLLKAVRSRSIKTEIERADVKHRAAALKESCGKKKLYPGKLKVISDAAGRGRRRRIACGSVANAPDEIETPTPDTDKLDIAPNITRVRADNEHHGSDGNTLSLVQTYTQKHSWRGRSFVENRMDAQEQPQYLHESLLNDTVDIDIVKSKFSLLSQMIERVELLDEGLFAAEFAKLKKLSSPPELDALAQELRPPLCWLRSFY